MYLKLKSGIWWNISLLIFHKGLSQTDAISCGAPQSQCIAPNNLTENVNFWNVIVQRSISNILVLTFWQYHHQDLFCCPLSLSSLHPTKQPTHCGSTSPPFSTTNGSSSPPSSPSSPSFTSVATISLAVAAPRKADTRLENVNRTFNEKYSSGSDTKSKPSKVRFSEEATWEVSYSWFLFFLNFSLPLRVSGDWGARGACWWFVRGAVQRPRAEEGWQVRYTDICELDIWFCQHKQTTNLSQPFFYLTGREWSGFWGRCWRQCIGGGCIARSMETWWRSSKPKKNLWRSRNSQNTWRRRSCSLKKQRLQKSQKCGFPKENIFIIYRMLTRVWGGEKENISRFCKLVAPIDQYMIEYISEDTKIQIQIYIKLLFTFFSLGIVFQKQLHSNGWVAVTVQITGKPFWSNFAIITECLSPSMAKDHSGMRAITI